MTFPSLAGKIIKLGSFRGVNNFILDSTLIDDHGNASFNISEVYPSVAYLICDENKPYFLIIDENEQIRISGERLSIPKSIKIIEGQQNQIFTQYSSEHPKREQALSAWTYLEKMYLLDSMFSGQKIPLESIKNEKLRLRIEDQNFLLSLNTKDYVSWYLPTRRLISDVPTIAQFRNDEIQSTISALRKLDYSDDRLYRSGLLKDAIESHFWLIENSGQSLDSVFIEMKVSIDSMIIQLSKNENRLNEITDYLFDLLERHSLFEASEYLAFKVLNETSCTLNSKLAMQLETYRAMKVGNTAPEIFFSADLLTNSSNPIKKLSDIKSDLVLVVFGASWCEKCTSEVPRISNLYTKWRSKGLEVLFISLDESRDSFQHFVSSFPFISYCDYGKWESKVAKDYYIFGTPTMFLLDNNRKILLRPNSINQMDAWVDWFQKNRH